MFRRQTSGSILCPSCGLLVGVNDEQCLNCGRRRPGLWGFTGPLALLRSEEGFVHFVIGTCGVLYAITLLADPSGIGFDGLFSMLSPSSVAAFRLGAAGSLPVYEEHRWWTLLSAGWLHGSLPHLVLNMLAIRNLGPGMVRLYGTSRTILVYVLSCVAGFFASSTANYFLDGLPWPITGAGLTLGASASLFGFLGAILYYGRRGGSSLIRDQAVQWIVGGLIFGFVIQGVDNWAHLGGLGGGYLAAVWLDPLKPERGDHAVAAVVLLVLSLASVALSFVTSRY